MGKGTYNAGVGKGNEDHFIVQHERADDKKGIFQKRVDFYIILLCRAIRLIAIYMKIYKFNLFDL